MKWKKASVQGLIGLILLIIIFYIVFLPPGDREELLGESDGNGESSQETVGMETTLLKEYPGTLTYLGKKDIKKTIPNVYLIETTNAEVLEKFNAFYVRNGIFDKKETPIEFMIDDLKNTDNVKLTFNVKKSQGVLMIKLNGETIYENEITSTNVEPIELKKQYLSEENVLEFSVSGVGVKFWTTNEYSLDNIQLIGDITDTSRQQSENTFTLTNEELQNLEEAQLSFIPYCSRETSVGALEVMANNRRLYSAVPVCDDLVRQEVAISVLDAGENNIVFKSLGGSYSIEQIVFDIKLKESKTMLFYFEVNESIYDKIIEGSLDAVAYIKFVEDDEEKRFELNVNDHLRTVEQDENDYSKNINSWIEEGNNYIEIRPKTQLDIVEIRVEIEEK